MSLFGHESGAPVFSSSFQRCPIYGVGISRDCLAFVYPFEHKDFLCSPNLVGQRGWNTAREPERDRECRLGIEKDSLNETERESKSFYWKMAIKYVSEESRDHLNACSLHSHIPYKYCITHALVENLCFCEGEVTLAPPPRITPKHTERYTVS